MATYAAFKHVELFNVGNAKKRVLKPPGGGSSDLFGSETPATPRSGVKNRMQSNIFAGDATKSANGEVRRTAPVDSHNRLFGDLQRPYTPAKNHMKSNLPIAQVDEPDTKQMNGNGKMNGHHNGNTNGNHQVATNGHTNGHSNGHSEQQNGNPVTGEGYKTNGHAEINTTVPALNTGHHVINKNRIPPGGFSSGLW